MTYRVRVHRTGSPEVLRWEEVDLGALQPHQVRVRQIAIGVNFIDTYHRSGLYPLPYLPHGIGMEATGIIEEVGREVTEFQVGQRIAYVGGEPGAYSQSRIVGTERLIPLPRTITHEQAAAILLKGMTVEYLIRRCFPVRAGMTVLWHAAAGGVGLLACQWLSSLGVKIIGTVSSEAKAKLAKENGCTYPINYNEEDFESRVQDITQGQGVPVVFDSVGRDTFIKSLNCLQARGMMVSFGNASGAPQAIDPLMLSQKGSLFLTRPTLWHYTSTRKELYSCARNLFQAFAEKRIEAKTLQRFALSEATTAHRQLEARSTCGSTILIAEP